eukprot:12292103-Alexandrium_andersonii.AAC.1
MSASLVGSEMCIRDRGITPAPQSGHTAGGGRPQTRAAVDTPPRATWRTVSYTHLTLPTICSV